MIQGLLSGVVEVQRKTTSPISSPSQSAATSPTTSSSEAPQQNLRCPRCDSSNTKFCYYNNYNLTQPRHFCKTCRRYWTKGGALRNVPIGGGCRKTKSIAPSIAASAGSMSGSTNKINKPITSLTSISDTELLPSSPMLCAGMPHSSHLLALMRVSQMQNLNPNASLLNSIRVKEAQMVADANRGVNGGHGLSLVDHLGQYYHYQQQQAQQQNLLLNDMPTSSGIQELYQRLRSSSLTSSYRNSYDNLQVIADNNCLSSVANTTVATTTAASIFEPTPQNVGDIGYWNPPMMMWPDLSTIANGALP